MKILSTFFIICWSFFLKPHCIFNSILSKWSCIWLYKHRSKSSQKQPFRGIPEKRCSENMQQIYRRTPMSKCDFNKVALQHYWNHTLAWAFSCKFAAYFQNTFSLRYTNADLKISLYVCRHIEIIPSKFRILNPKNCLVIYP